MTKLQLEEKLFHLEIAIDGLRSIHKNYEFTIAYLEAICVEIRIEIKKFK